MRRVETKQEWSFDDDPIVAGSNARVALALMRCVRGLPGALPRRSHDDVARVLAPAIAKAPALLRKALKSAKSRQLLGELLPEASVSVLLNDTDTLMLIGEAMETNMAAFRQLFDRTEHVLESFIAGHVHPADRNVASLSRILALSEPAARFLRLAAAFPYATISASLFTFVVGSSRIARAVGLVVGCGPQDAAKLFEPDMPLWRSGLLRASERSGSVRDLEDLLDLSSIGDRLLCYAHNDENALAAAVLKPFGPPVDESIEWPHLEQQRQLLEGLLRNASAQRVPGVNILIHGEPGTGKTEFVKKLLHDMGMRAFAIDHTDEDGREASRSRRLSHLQLSRIFAGHSAGAVLVVDEAEDIFVGDHHHPLASLFRSKDHSKAWMNEILETAPQPIVWISNKVRHIDPAYLRRFTYCLPLPKPPQAMRKTMVRRQLEPLGCTDGVMDAIAALECATPALIGAAARFVSLSQGAGVPPDQAAQAMIQGHLDTSGVATTLRSSDQRREFDMSLVNLAGSVTAPALMKWLQEEGAGTVLLSGPPGTGKTQLAAELARQLGRKLVVKTASDILSKWYGESERNVAAMFRQCDPKTEVLFLDEGDVLLADRGQASQRADQGVTAEFLRWLEEFQGIFICATNYPQHLDAALARRFAHRLNFLPLNAEQRRSQLAKMALGDPLATLDHAACVAIDQLDRLTPGDFANVRRRLRHQQATMADWLSELTEEQAMKPGAQSRSIGFV